MACAVTALPILVLLMEKAGDPAPATRPAHPALRQLDDIAIWGVLALILLDWQRVGRQGWPSLRCSRWGPGLRKLMLRLSASATAGTSAWSGWPPWRLGADWSGLHFMVGAFLAGAVMDATGSTSARWTCCATTCCWC
jgi:hypothetical protein